MIIYRYSVGSFRRRYKKKIQLLFLFYSFHNVIFFCLAATPIINTNYNRQSSVWRTPNQMSSEQCTDMMLSSEKLTKSRSGMLGNRFCTNANTYANADANASLFRSSLKDSKYYHRRVLLAFQPSPMQFPQPPSIQRNHFKICRPRQAKSRSLNLFCHREEDGYEKSHHERLTQWLSDTIRLVHASTSLLPILFIISSCLCIDPQTSLALTSTTTKENIYPMQTMLTTPSTGTSTAQPPNANAATSTAEDSQNARPYKGKRYWDTITNPDTPISQIKSTNEALLDLAVGTINNMYYDNSGGASFSTQDMYDRWRLLRVYAKEGIDGVKELKQKEIRRLEQVRVQVREDGYMKEDDFGGSMDPTKDGTFLSRLILNGNDVEIAEGTNAGFGVGSSSNRDEKVKVVPKNAFDSRENAVEGLKWLVSTLNDPFSKYLTREELREELEVRNDGFLGLGALVETPPNSFNGNSHLDWNSYGSIPVASSSAGDSNTAGIRGKDLPGQRVGISSSNNVLSKTRVLNLPIVTAVSPDSPAERAGIVVGDRIAAVGGDKFVGLGRDEVKKKIKSTYSGAENYVGYPDLTIAKPIVQIRSLDLIQENTDGSGSGSVGTSGKQQQPREQVLGYKLSRVRLPTQSISPFRPYMPPNLTQFPMVSFASNDASAQPQSSSSIISPIAGGDAIVHYELLTPDDSIFSRSASFTTTNNNVLDNNIEQKVGYIRLTRFSRSSTKGYINAIKELEKAGAQSFIIDVRNNYGGVIQESMLTASSLLRDPHTVLCYTLNSRGGFTPHDVEEYIVDKRYPGYLLSSEKPSVSLEQVKRDDPEFVSGEGWYPPSSYASLHEQRMKRGIRRAVTGGGGVEPANAYETTFNNDIRIRTKALQKIFSKPENVKRAAEERKQILAQKKIVILMNEGTASSAEVFVSSLKDNGRTVALVGTRTYGKGLIQHTFPMPDGGGLRLTVAEYLTPALQHVTKVGDARIDPNTGDFSGGVKPDIYCPSTQGIPSNIGADICVGMALDALQDADTKEMEGGMASYPAKYKSNAPVVTQGIVRDDF